MKSLAELQAIKEKMKDKVVLREGTADVRVVVGMATCGIAAGARPVLNAIVECVNEGGLADKVTVSQTGCIGLCQYEPIVEIFEAGKDKVTYVKMDADKAKRVVEEHLKGGKIVTDYTIAAAKN
ncbi:MAG: (2Fe-2S) ferredoxin domain-containing protein [Clostridia bacterium]|nr:(2Fe-2S) ferredoxin domain-containing protein [Oscillospiraceae bacterium]MBP3600287.1 (2Fe-2S) ferredoxin domain-containing protein [Clostridia bacterium]